MKRMFPDKPLGKPVRRFDETFSAETVLRHAFRMEKLLEDPEIRAAVHRRPSDTNGVRQSDG